MALQAPRWAPGQIDVDKLTICALWLLHFIVTYDHNILEVMEMLFGARGYQDSLSPEAEATTFENLLYQDNLTIVSCFIPRH